MYIYGVDILMTSTYCMCIYDYELHTIHLCSADDYDLPHMIQNYLFIFFHSHFHTMLAS